MKKKDTVDYKALTMKDLKDALSKKRNDLSDLMLEHAQRKLKNTRSLFEMRKEIARILTAVQQKNVTLPNKEDVK